jgi:hypothetical protein
MMYNTLPKLAIVALLVAQLLNLVALSAEGQGLEYRLKAELIERFTRFIEWPADSSVQDA